MNSLNLVLFFAFLIIGNKPCFTVMGSNVPYASEEAAELAMPGSASLNVNKIWKWSCAGATVCYAIIVFNTVYFDIMNIWRETYRSSATENDWNSWFQASSAYITYLVMVLIHAIRFSHSGYVCSGTAIGADGKMIRDDPQYADNVMPAKGGFFMFYIVTSWIVLPLFVLIPMICIKGKHAGMTALKYNY